MKGILPLLLVNLMFSAAAAVTLKDLTAQVDSGSPFTQPRRLELDAQESLDDATIFGNSDLKADQSLASQLLLTSMDQAPINFNESLENIQNQLDAIRRNVDTTLSNQVRISALNAYINNAVLMNNLGLLGAAEDESLVNPTADSYIAAKKARKLTKTLRTSPPVGKQRSTKLFNQYAARGRTRRVMAYKPKSRKLLKTTTPEATAAAPQQPNERRLAQTWVAVQPKKPVKKQRSYHVSQIHRIRINDEMMELAKTGSLFHVDFGSIYKVSNDDLNRYMEQKEPGSGRNI